MENKQIIQVEQAKYAYLTGENTYELALNGVDVSISKGAFVAVVGHNGSGKSTFARLLNALVLPSDGKVYIEGMDTSNEDQQLAIRKKVGMVFQNPDNQLVATVVDEDVAFGPENLGVPQPEILKRVDAALSAVGMLDFKKKAPHMLSGGQKQRVAIAGILAMQPDIMVFDEATAMLDPKGRKDVLSIMQRLHQQGMTILMITHFMEEVVLADQVIVLSNGYVLKQGTPQEVLWDFETLKQAELLPPFAVQMAYDLQRESGISLGHPITNEELAEELCRL